MSRCSYRHLEPGGILAFDIFNPDLGRLVGLNENEIETLLLDECRMVGSLPGDDVLRQSTLASSFWMLN